MNSKATPLKSAGSERLVALDVFRGLTVALMILVNTPGSWAHIHPPLRHAQWHGLTPTDLVFPFFLFIVGVAISLGFSSRLEKGASRPDLVRKITTRSIIIFGLGLFLNGFPFGLVGDVGFREGLSGLRIWGVLQRIAVCYLLVGLVVVFFGNRGRWLVMIGWLLTYELLMRLSLVAGWGAGSFALEDNFIRLLDLQTVGASHMHQVGRVAFDPEGLLSTLPAAVTTLLGFLTGDFLRQPKPLTSRLGRLFLVGLLLTSLGWNLALFEPLNKQLWTSSYVALTGGFAILFLAFCLWVIDVKDWRHGSQLAVVFGRNPLLVFVGSGVLVRTLDLIKVTNSVGDKTSLKYAIYHGVFEPLAGPVNGSLLYALSFLALWLVLLYYLHAKDIHIKV